MKLTIKKAQFGDKWPFVPDELIIEVLGTCVIAIHEKKKYALNGMAQNHRLGEDLGPIWLPHPEQNPPAKASLFPIYNYLKRRKYL